MRYANACDLKVQKNPQKILGSLKMNLLPSQKTEQNNSYFATKMIAF